MSAIIRLQLSGKFNLFFQFNAENEVCTGILIDVVIFPSSGLIGDTIEVVGWDVGGRLDDVKY